MSWFTILWAVSILFVIQPFVACVAFTKYNKRYPQLWFWYTMQHPWTQFKALFGWPIFLLWFHTTMVKSK